MKKVVCTLVFVAVAWLISPALAADAPRAIHVLVALCDNDNQGIVPVPPAIGKGDDPAGNLYWGCAYGVSTFMKKRAEWTFVESLKNPTPEILERLVFQHKKSGVWLVADAYDGRYIKKTTEDLLEYASGRQKMEIAVKDRKTAAGGDADLLVYVGHNGLMDFDLDWPPLTPTDDKKRDVAVFACASKPYFYDRIIQAGARPSILTTNLMCPEAYTAAALAEGWINKESPAAVHERVAAAYSKYQKCGLKASRGLFTAPVAGEAARGQ